VRYGETLSGIARAYGTSVWAIASANGISNPNYIRAGMCLTIPSGGYGGYGGYKPTPHYGGYYGGYKPTPYYGGYTYNPKANYGGYYGGYYNYWYNNPYYGGYYGKKW
jgi:LysM repeat protein